MYSKEKTAVDAQLEQLRQIKAILVNAFAVGQSGLQCSDSPNRDTQDICVTIDALLLKTKDRQEKLEKEFGLVENEFLKIQNYKCDCAYNAWPEKWSKCSKTCRLEGEAAPTQFQRRGLKWKPRNGGVPQDDSQLHRQRTCNDIYCRKLIFYSFSHL